MRVLIALLTVLLLVGAHAGGASPDVVLDAETASSVSDDEVIPHGVPADEPPVTRVLGAFVRDEDAPASLAPPRVFRPPRCMFV